AFFAEQGIEPETFSKVYNAFSVDTKTRRANLLTRQYGVTGVPALVVNGKYRVSGTHVTSYGEMVEVVNYLIEKERALKSQDSMGTPTTTTTPNSLDAPITITP
ncbi:MAG: hypothetical protein BWK79_09945, partial [Beggiatoa sp. IS2]